MSIALHDGAQLSGTTGLSTPSFDSFVAEPAHAE
jgi:hypothetical protein